MLSPRGMRGSRSNRPEAERYVHPCVRRARSITELWIQAKARILQTGRSRGSLVARGAIPVSPHGAKGRRSDRAPWARSPGAEGFRTEAAQMKKLIIPAFVLTVVQSTALAAPATASGPSALALAAVIAQHSPAVRAFDKRVIARLFRGKTNFGFTPNTKISVDAASVVCRVSNVDITSRSCELNFGARKRTLTGREANEVGATMAAAGIPSEGAAGSSIESVSQLRCTIDPNEIMQKAGGGAQCSFETGQ